MKYVVRQSIPGHSPGEVLTEDQARGLHHFCTRRADLPSDMEPAPASVRVGLNVPPVSASSVKE